MEGEKSNCSTFSVPGAMSDLTILSTPLPQAASTATKRRFVMEDEGTSRAEELLKEFDTLSQPSSSYNYGGLRSELLDQLKNSSKRHSAADAGLPTSAVLLGNEYPFRVPQVPKTNYRATSSTNNLGSSQNKLNTKSQKNKSPRNADDNVPEKLIASGRISYHEMDIKKSPKDIKKDIDKVSSKSRKSESFLRSNVSDISFHEEFLPSLAKYQTTGDLSQYQDHRNSVASSANSSLGVLPDGLIEDAAREPLVDVNQDLSLRLAQKLNLDTSLLKEGMDISKLANEAYKEKVAAKYENKENQRNSGRSSSDYWTLHGYSSDNSDSKNNTAKRLSSLSSESGRESDPSQKSISYPRRSLRPLSEMNYSTHSSSSSRSGRSSLGSNPFGSYSNVSVSSEDFQSGEDAMQRLERDERQFSMASTRSLSGIYDSNVSVNVDGEKLSMSSFLRSGSYPLGSLESGYTDTQCPQFGLQSKSPEKRGKPMPILPPPQDKSTFVVEEEPVRDTPWMPNSLMEQYSHIHDADGTDADVDASMPSLSYIGDMLEKVHQGANPKEMLAQFLASKNKPKNRPENSVRVSTISSFVEGENSFCQGIESERNIPSKDKSRMHYSSSGQDASVEESVCNVTDFEGDEEACVCVLTPQSMDFDIHNELPHPAEYSFSKACYVDGLRNDSAAYVHLPRNKLMLYPGQKRTLTINIAAFVAGVIKVKIEVARRNPITQAREYSNVFGKIVAEIPKVFLVSEHESEMAPNPMCEYNGKYQHTIQIQNKGQSTVPLKLTVTKLDDEDVKFHLGDGKQSVTLMIVPGQLYSQVVHCETPPVFNHIALPEAVMPVKAVVEFSLATTDLYKLSPITPVSLVALLKPHFFGAPAALVVPSNLSLYNGADQPVTFNASTGLGYTVHPSNFSIPSGGKFIVSVNTAEIKNPVRHGELTLRASYPMGNHSTYTVQLREDSRSSLSSNNSLATPHSSRATSPTSPSSSRGVVSGDLKLACSHKKLVWGGCPLHQRTGKVFCLKNMGNQREKLRLTLSSICFKIVGEDDSLKTELKLSLQPMENRELKVVVLATVGGPQWGHLTVSRISCAADKTVLPLYAFGGKPKMAFSEGVFELEAKKFLFLNEGTLQGSFTLSNTGDSAAFFRVTEANSKSSAGLSIAPQESVLTAGRFATIHVKLDVTAKRLEYLLRQSGPSVCVAQISVHWGDESTRQRLLRMRGLRGILAVRVSQLARIPSAAITDLDKLDGSENGAEGLWEEDTDEYNVGVFIKRTALEAIRLDTCDDFVDLSKTLTSDLA